MPDLLDFDGASLVAAYRRRVVSPREAVTAALNAAERMNPAVNAFCLLDRGGASPAVDWLLKAGAIPIGKTTLPEFGWKGLGDSLLNGPVRNPWDTALTTGGSSAGAAAAAALNLGILHIGTDGAGSIRIPASFCGVYGLKPSYGRVPAFPPTPFAIVSHLGPLTRTVADAALMLGVMAQPDGRDITA